MTPKLTWSDEILRSYEQLYFCVLYYYTSHYVDFCSFDSAVSFRKKLKILKKPSPKLDKFLFLIISLDIDKLAVGMNVNIRRSDGRVHSALVTQIARLTGMISVEWFERVCFIYLILFNKIN